MHIAATHCNTLQNTATHCNTLQHAATHCNTLHHTTIPRTTLIHTLHPVRGMKNQAVRRSKVSRLSHVHATYLDLESRFRLVRLHFHSPLPPHATMQITDYMTIHITSSVCLYHALQRRMSQRRAAHSSPAKFQRKAHWEVLQICEYGVTRSYV